MNIIIESGATKSTSIGYTGVCTFFIYKTTGINATYATKDAIFEIVEDIIAKNNVVANDVENIRYYGAGCFNTNNAEKVKNVLTSLFPKATIVVFSDLLAACHALCKNRSGFVGILGTGSATCYYDGAQIVSKAPSLGWLLGDEGSGVYLGKLFVKEYLTDKLEQKIVQDFEKSFSVSKAIVLEKVYQNPTPQTFFASIPVFLQKKIENKQIKTLVENSFQDFFDKQTEYYSEIPSPLFFCGSIAYYFQEILIETAHKNDLKIEKIIRECAEELVDYPLK
jgi:N-acetylglucosamine kinase-like BadF-type ATPase